MNHTRSNHPLLLTLALLFALAAVATGCATTTEAPDLLRWKVEQSHPYVMASEVTEHVITVEVAAELPSTLETRIPLNLSVVIDHSGSMTAEQLQHAKDAVLYMLDQLQDDDTVSVIAFSTRVAVLQPQTEWGDVERGELRAAINDLQPRGTTAMYEALYQGYNEVYTRLDGARINRIILFSDGIPNDPTNILSMAQTARGAGIAITTMGLGPHYNEDLMAQIADSSGGNYRFIKDSREIAQFFAAEKRALEQVVARNVNLSFNLGPGAELVQTLGGQGSFNGRVVSVYLGDLSVSDPRQIAVKINVKAPSSGARVEILDAQLTWEDVVAWSGYHEAWAYVEAESTRDQALIDKHHNKLVVEKAGRLHAAWQLENAVRDYQAGRREDARRQLEQAASQYREEKKAAEAWLQQQEVERDRLQQVPADANSPQPAPPSPSFSGGASQLDAPASVDSRNFDAYLQSTITSLEELDASDGEDGESEEDEDKTKIIIKSVKSRVRLEAGQ